MQIKRTKRPPHNPPAASTTGERHPQRFGREIRHLHPSQQVAGRSFYFAPRSSSAEPAEITTPPLGTYNARSLSFHQFGESGVQLKYLEIEKGYPNEYIEFLRRLTVRVKGKPQQIGSIVEKAITENRHVYLGQGSLGLPKRIFMRRKPPHFFAIIGESRELKSGSHPIVQRIIDDLHTRLGIPGGSLTFSAPERQIIYKEIFHQLVRELTFDPVIYRFLLKQSAIFDFSLETAEGDWSKTKITSDGAPMAAEFWLPILEKVKSQVRERVLDRLDRQYWTEQSRKHAISVFTNPDILHAIRTNEHVQFVAGNQLGYPEAIVITGLRESIYDNRINGQIDLFKELERYCAAELKGLGSCHIDIRIDEHGRGNVYLNVDDTSRLAHPSATAGIQKIRQFVQDYMSIYSVSDIHFMTGTRTDKFMSAIRRVEIFKELLLEVIAKRATLVLDGDIFDDLRVIDINSILNAPAYKEIFRLLRQVRRVIYIPGNHDSVVLSEVNGISIDTLNYRMWAWHQRVRNRFRGAGLISGIFAGPALLYRWYKRRNPKPSISGSIQRKLRSKFPRMKIVPYYMDTQRGLVFEHGDAASSVSVPRILIKPFLLFTRGIVWTKYWIDRLLLSQYFRGLRVFFCSRASIRHRVNRWLRMDIDNGFEAFYHWLRIWIYPGPILDGKFGIIRDRVIHPANRIQVLGEMAQWFTRQQLRSWTFTFGHKHLEESRDEGAINEILRRIFTQCEKDNICHMDRIRYVNDGDWAGHSFLHGVIENAWKHENPNDFLPESESNKDSMGVMAFYPFADPHKTELRRYLRSGISIPV